MTMNLLEGLQIAGGSVIGTEHQRLGRNNQDAWAVHLEADRCIAVVADGCGSGRFSEVGARLGAHLLVEFLRRNLLEERLMSRPLTLESARLALERTRIEMLEQLGLTARAMGSSLATTVGDCFLFTLVGFFATRQAAGVFHVGDGAIAWNGELTILEAPGNAPAYLCYELTGTTLQAMAPGSLRFQLDRFAPLDALGSVLIGTDGVRDLCEASGRCFPGGTEPVGPLSRLWEDDLLFDNPDGLRRRLARANLFSQRPDWEARRLVKAPGLLTDDTTVIVIRSGRGEKR